VKPSRQAKYRQVEEFLRLLDQSVSAAIESGRLRAPTPDDPLRVVDLGCGNAYLTFAAQAFLSERGIPVHLTGVDTKAQSLAHGEAVADQLGVGATFVQGGITDAVVDPAPEVVLALHACDTATDDALARAVGWDARLVLAAPCCHHDIAAQLRRAPTPAPRSPTRSVPRCCGCTATGSTWSSSSAASTLPATPCCVRCARGRTRSRRRRRSTTT
jgi:SAM-dependent methyltransferase